MTFGDKLPKFIYMKLKESMHAIGKEESDMFGVLIRNHMEVEVERAKRKHINSAFHKMCGFVS